jgi:GT2 family glycosyltransferase
LSEKTKEAHGSLRNVNKNTSPVGSSAYHEVLAVIPTLGKDMPRLEAVIRSVREHSVKDSCHLVIVDNSKGGDLKELEGADEVLRYGLNLGWVGSLEVVRRKYNFKYLWAIQDDVLLQNDVLENLKTDLDQNPTRGVASPVVVKNGIVPSRSLGCVIEEAETLKLSCFPKVPTSIVDLEIPSDLCCVFACGALWRASALLSIGGFSLNLFPVWNVDVDTCLRLIGSGWSLNIVVEAHVDHQSRGSQNTILTNVLKSINKEILISNVSGARSSYGGPADSDIDHQILLEIAAKSTHLVLEVSETASKRLGQWQAHPWLSALVSSSIFQYLYRRHRRLLVSSNPMIRTAAVGLRDTLKKMLGMS